MLNTPYPFQQKVKRNPSTYQVYEVPDLGNFRFCADNVCNTQLNAWLESCTPSCTPTATSASAWVQLTSSIAGWRHSHNLLRLCNRFPRLSTASSAQRRPTSSRP